MMSSNNGNLEHLVEQITDVIVARLNGDADSQAQMCGCGSTCFNRCPERMQRVVDAGASRIGLVLGETATARDWSSLVDHTLLKPEASDADIRKLCEEAAQYRFASVCVNPGSMIWCSRTLAKSWHDPSLSQIWMGSGMVPHRRCAMVCNLTPWKYVFLLAQ
jgi:hypothetical protein